MATEVVHVVDPDEGAGYDYASLNAWEAAEQGDLTGVRDEIAIAKCRSTSGSADTTGVYITGWTCSATQYIKIWTDPAESYRHDGKWPSGNKYRLETSGESAFQLYGAAEVKYVKIFGLAIEAAADGNYENPIYIEDVGTTDVEVGYCVIRNGDTGGTYRTQGIMSNDADATLHIYNNHIYGFLLADYGKGIWLVNCAAANIYNNTIHTNYIGIDQDSGTVTAKNNAVFNNTDDFSGTITLDYNASDDGDGTNAEDFTAEATDWNTVFTDYDGTPPDVSLLNYTSSPCCVGQGTDNPGSGLYSDDIIGTARSSTWDIGAFEYAAAEIEGTTCWGHSTDVEETNTRTFSGNWTGTGEITGSGDSEQIELDAGEYMESEVVNTGAVDIELLQNEYGSGDTVTLSYRTSATSTMSGEWTEYTVPFTSSGYVQVRVEVAA